MLAERLTFTRPHGGRFQIGPAALETMLRYVQGEPTTPEAGGVMLGRHLIDTNDVVVDQVTAPQPGDRRGRFRFFRARRRHQGLIDAAWQESDGTRTYLGEWHTHPEPVPRPSVVDHLNWQRKLLFDHFSEPLFFLIVGTMDIEVWEGRPRYPIMLLRRQ